MAKQAWDVEHLAGLSGVGSARWDDEAIFRGATGRAADIAPDPDEAYALALLREREGYVRRGLAERTATVDAELARIGHPIASTSQSSAEQPATRKRRTATRSTGKDPGARGRPDDATPESES
jgi:hypothetical protein